MPSVQPTTEAAPEPAPAADPRAMYRTHSGLGPLVPKADPGVDAPRPSASGAHADAADTRSAAVAALEVGQPATHARVDRTLARGQADSVSRASQRRRIRRSHPRPQRRRRSNSRCRRPRRNRNRNRLASCTPARTTWPMPLRESAAAAAASNQAPSAPSPDVAPAARPAAAAPIAETLSSGPSADGRRGSGWLVAPSSRVRSRARRRSRRSHRRSRLRRLPSRRHCRRSRPPRAWLPCSSPSRSLSRPSHSPWRPLPLLRARTAKAVPSKTCTTSFSLLAKLAATRAAQSPPCPARSTTRTIKTSTSYPVRVVASSAARPSRRRVVSAISRSFRAWWASAWRLLAWRCGARIAPSSPRPSSPPSRLRKSATSWHSPASTRWNQPSPR